MIKISIPRELVPGFGMDAGAVSGTLGSPSRSRGRREESGRRDKDERGGRNRDERRGETHLPRNPERQERTRAPQPPADPIFSRPYEPSGSSSTQPAVAVKPAGGSRQQRPIAALLGGMPKQKSG